MCDELKANTLTKREFVRYCLWSACGVALGARNFDALAAMAADMSISSPESDEPWKWSKEALFYKKTPDGVQCLKCPHGCFLTEGETGVCRNRVNFKGKLYSIAYGNPCAVHIDPIEKKPLFHFLPSTRAYSIAAAGCNLRCLNCQNWQISQFSPKETENLDLMPAAVAEQAAKNHCQSIAYTYSEPTTFYEYVLDTAQRASERHIRNVVKSSGYINEGPLRTLSKHVDAANIDLKNFDDNIYRKLSSARLDPVLNTLRVLKAEGVWLEITNLIIPGWTDDVDMIKRMSDWLCDNELESCPLHFTRFSPLYRLTSLPATPVSALEKAREIALKAGVRYVYIGNVPGHHAESTYCHGCGKMIIERKGFAITAKHLLKDECTFCHETIPGVWK